MPDGPEATLIGLRLLMEPFRVLRAAQFSLGSTEWHLAQVRREMLHVEGRGDGTRRDFPVVLATRRALEIRFYEQVEILLTDERL